MVVPKRRTSGPQQQGVISNTSAQLKYRSFVETSRSAAKGTKPLPNPITIPEIFTKVMIHCCKRILYVDPKFRLLGYAVLLFFLSLVADYMPFPKTYFSSSNNFFNQFFVKFSWAWTFSFVGIFLLLTSSVLCCADRKQIGRNCIRLFIATLIWFVWTSLFTTIEELTGKCIYVSPGNPSEAVYSKGRRPCITNGGKWTSFDISGHSFLLIWCVLFIIEETRPIIGWDVIEDHIRNEEHKRSDLISSPENSPETPLSCLSDEDFVTMKKLYKNFGVTVKMTVVFLTFLTLVWDLMLIMTACYFHIMIEKVIGGLIAIVMWCATYGAFYKLNTALSPGLPGSGKFKYSTFQHGYSTKTTTSSSTTKSKPKNGEEIPLFMGMPLYALGKKQKETTNDGVRGGVLVPSK